MLTKKIAGIVCFLALLTACSISYTFNNATIDYTKIQSISIKDFPNRAANVYPPLAQLLTEEIKDYYTRRTRLQILKANGDLDLEGEIIGYDLTPLAVKEDAAAGGAFSSRTRLTITVRVRYTNKVNPDEDFEQSFSAYDEFDSSRMITEVQDELCAVIVKELVDQVYNSTVANW